MHSFPAVYHCSSIALQQPPSLNTPLDGGIVVIFSHSTLQMIYSTCNICLSVCVCWVFPGANGAKESREGDAVRLVGA